MSESVTLRRGDVVIIALADPVHREIGKRRPFVVVSPDELNMLGGTHLVAPLTTGHHPYIYRVPCQFAGRKGHVVLDQMIVVDSSRTSQSVGRLVPAALREVLAALRDMFEE